MFCPVTVASAVCIDWVTMLTTEYSFEPMPLTAEATTP